MNKFSLSLYIGCKSIGEQIEEQGFFMDEKRVKFYQDFEAQIRNGMICGMISQTEHKKIMDRFMKRISKDLTKRGD